MSTQLEELIHQAHARLEARDLDGAVRIAQEGLKLDPGHPIALQIYGVAAALRGRWREALVPLQRSLQGRPDHAPTLLALGRTQLGLGQCQDAIRTYERLGAIGQIGAEVWINLGNAYSMIGQLARAITCFDRVLQNEPRQAHARLNRGHALFALGRHAEALEDFDRAIELDAELVQAWSNRALALGQLARYDEESQTLVTLRRLAPDFPFVTGRLLFASMMSCEWHGYASLVDAVTAGIRNGKPSIHPFAFQAIASREEDLLSCARFYSQAHHPPISKADPVRAPAGFDPEQIRIGYLGGEFRHQATSILLINVFELHDQMRFPIVAFDNGWDDGSSIRGRLQVAFSEIVDISRLPDAQAADAIRARGIDILVDLNGFFGRSRQSLLARRPAALQVSYLGFPGTLGTSYIDYLIADRTVIPPASRSCYAEKIVYLPDTYQANDSQRVIAATAGARREHGLPEAGFVFACFNNTYKITPDIFAVWMQILAGVSGSVLWLLQPTAAAETNLTREAARRGIDPSRLIFAPRLPLEQHLARHRLADLFLDTLPYNAHTTASDALWAGLPVLTRMGSTFPGRVTASLLYAMGLPELVTETPTQYTQLAVELARHREALAELRERLARNRQSCPLFDAQARTRQLEAAYALMWERHRRGLPPAHIEACFGGVPAVSSASAV